MATPPHVTADSVVVVLAPFLTWNDFSARSPSGEMLGSLAKAGAIGNMNAITADAGWPTVPGGALTLGSGRWTAGPVGSAASTLALSAIASANAGSLNPPQIGALGSVLHAAGRTTAAIGCGDEDTTTPAGTKRSAELLAMDATGRVDVDRTGSEMLVANASWPYGVRSSGSAIASAVAGALDSHAALIVVDPGDLERAHDAPNRTAAAQTADHANAVEQLGEIVGNLTIQTTGHNALLLIVACATDKPYYEPPYFGPIAAVGPGYHDLLRSASTHRDGLVTNLDIAPTILSALSLEATETMVGQPLTATVTSDLLGPLAIGNIDELARAGSMAGAVDYTRDLLFLHAFADAAMWLVAIAAALALLPVAARVRSVARGALLLALAIPPGAWLLFAIDRYPTSPGRVLLAFGVATLATFALVLALTIALRSRPEIPLLAMSSLTALLICLDQWTGHPFESGLFSYSIRAGWRYYGMGNEGAALLVGATLLACGIACDLATGTRLERLARVALVPAAGAIAIVTTAASFAGANVGVAIWGVVAFGAMWAAVNRVGWSWRTVALVVVAVLVLVAVLAGIDMLSSGGETHIGRFFGSAASGDFSAIRVILVRKALNNYNYLPQTPYTWLALVLVLALAATRWAGSRPLARALATRPGVAAALLGVLLGGVAATLSEDSGVVMPALMLYAGAIPALSLALLSEPPVDETEGEFATLA